MNLLATGFSWHVLKKNESFDKGGHNVKIAQITDTGLKRKQNEDQIGVFYNASDQALLLLCDGMGGQNAGDVASEMALYQVGVNWEKTEDMRGESTQNWLTEVFIETNTRILDKSNQYEDLLGMGTTIVALACLGREVIIAHVGDSRAYHIRQGVMTQITKDHSYVQELVDNHIISAEEAKHHPQKNIITQSMGVNPSIEVDLIRLHVSNDDIFVLCSDGLSDMLDDEQILEIICHEPHIDEALTKLVEAANAAGGRDNISIIAAHIEGDDLV